jgi:hypothetical protein
MLFQVSGDEENGEFAEIFDLWTFLRLLGFAAFFSIILPSTIADANVGTKMENKSVSNCSLWDRS